MLVKISSGLINIEEYGKRDGFPFLFIHGNQESLEIFKSYIEPLKEYHLIMMDSRCHGKSFDGELSYDLMAKDTIELLESLNISKCNVVGFSDGAIIGLMLSYRTGLINKLFAIGPNISPDGLIDEAIKYITEDFHKTKSRFDFLMLNEPNIKIEEIEEIKSRVVIIGGEHDLIKQEHFDLINEHIINSTKYIIEGANHFVAIERAAQVVEIIKNEMSLDVHYEDNQIIVVDKKEGILSQEDISGDDDVLSITKKYLKIKYNKPGNVYLGLIQRLDRNVSGLMVFAKTSKAAARLNENRPEKEYLAVVNGRMKEKEGSLVNYLLKDEVKLKAYESKDGKKSVLHYKTIAISNKYSLLSVKIDSGRFHQIRCQLSLSGHPIYNDLKYGAAEEMKKPYLGLDAYKVKLVHPVSKKILIFERKPDRVPFTYI